MISTNIKVKNIYNITAPLQFTLPISIPNPIPFPTTMTVVKQEETNEQEGINLITDPPKDLKEVQTENTEYTYKLFEEELNQNILSKILNKENIFEIISSREAPKKIIKKPRKIKLVEKEEKIEKVENTPIVIDHITESIHTNEDVRVEIENDTCVNPIEEDIVIKPKTVRANHEFSAVGSKIIINNYFNIFNQSICEPKIGYNLVENSSQTFNENEKSVAALLNTLPDTDGVNATVKIQSK